MLSSSGRRVSQESLVIVVLLDPFYVVDGLVYARYGHVALRDPFGPGIVSGQDKLRITGESLVKPFQVYRTCFYVLAGIEGMLQV